MIKLIKFYAQWCMPCKQYSKIIEKVKTETPELEVIEVDIEEDPDNLVEKYQVRSVPTTVILKNDIETFKKSGIIDYQTLLNELKNE